MNKKIFKKLLLITFICFTVIFISGNPVFGQLNDHNMYNETGFLANLLPWINKIIQTVLGIGLGALAAPLVSLAFVILMIIFSVMYFIFSPLSAGSFPFPDQIIFNRLAFFDPNFLNPPSITTSTAAVPIVSPVQVLQGLISNMYYSFYIVAGAVFLMAIMIIAIKLAIATIASDKAHYKKALTSWAFGLLLLFILPFLMAGIFKLNEMIVQAAYNAMAGSQIEFTISLTSLAGIIAGAATGGVGVAIVKGLTSIANLFGNVSDVGPAVPGYTGMILKYMVDAAGGDFVGLVIFGILLGQTSALIFQYTKRLFFIIILGMIAPLVIAADIIKQGI